jgi:hypothetical protein
MEMNSDDSMSLSSESGWSSSDDSDIEELLQDDDVEMMSFLVDVQEIEDRAKLLDHRRGSVMGREYIYRNRGLGHEQLMRDYFAKEHPTYPPRLFRRRYRMRRSLFVKIVNDCEAASDYFKRRRSASGQWGFSAYQKISAAMRVLAYGVPADYTIGSWMGGAKAHDVSLFHFAMSYLLRTIFYFAKNIVVIFGMIILCLRVLFDVVIITRMIIV